MFCFPNKCQKNLTIIFSYKIMCMLQFISGNFFVFVLFLGVVIYANEVETNEKLKLPEIKN